MVLSFPLLSSSFTPFLSVPQKEGKKEQPPFAQGWLMPELFSPHFIWWSSVSSLPLSIMQHSSPLSHSPSLPPLAFACPPSQCPPSVVLHEFRKIPPPPFPKRQARSTAFASTSTMNGSLSFQHLGWIQSEGSCWFSCLESGLLPSLPQETKEKVRSRALPLDSLPLLSLHFFHFFSKQLHPDHQHSHSWTLDSQIPVPWHCQFLPVCSAKGTRIHPSHCLQGIPPFSNYALYSFFSSEVQTYYLHSWQYMVNQFVTALREP